MNAPQEDKLLNILSLVQNVKTTLFVVLLLSLLFQLHATFGIYYPGAISFFVQYIHVC
jgi:hypothetical protein